MPVTPKQKSNHASSLSPNTPKRIGLSIEKKKDILKKYDKLPKMSQQSAANMLKIPRGTLRKILNKRGEIMASTKRVK